MNSEPGSAGKRQADWLRRAVVAAAVLALTGGAFAQQGARAARLSDVDGQVQLSSSVSNQVMAASAPANTPIFAGTRIATAEDGRAELQFDDGSIARVSPNSSLIVSVLRQQDGVNQTELVLESGLAYFELQGTSTAGNVLVHFGANTVTASGFTVLRLDLDNPPGAMAAFSGNARLENASALALDLHGGESASLNPNDPSSYVLAESIEPDSWDAWNADRDQELTTAEAQRTQATMNVPDPANPAWSDLDANGNWYNVPGAGFVWSPYAAGTLGWEPYGCGYWVWTPGYGYVWASCEPWGYLPYAGGSWGFYDGIGWGWNPGGGGWWWDTGGWNSTVAGTSAFKYTSPHRPHGGPISPGRGNPGGVAPTVVAVNRFHSDGNGSTAHPRGGPVTVGGVTLQPLHPVGVAASRSHEPSTGSSYTAANSGSRAPRSGAVTAGNGFAAGTDARGRALPSSGFVTYGQQQGSRPAFTAGAPRSTAVSGGGARPSGGSAGSSGGAAHSGSVSSGGGGGGGAVHSGGGSAPASSSHK